MAGIVGCSDEKKPTDGGEPNTPSNGLDLQARDAGQDAEASNNLKQIALSIHTFHDINHSLPAQGSYDKDGKPLLSWRVHMLNFLEGGDLYGQFHLNEAWDSPHNMKLSAKMPEVFSSPGRTLPEGKTCVVFPVSNDETYGSMVPKGAPFKRLANISCKGRTTFGSITDGLQNTIMIVEVSPEKAVIWTKPDDWEFKIKTPKDGLFGMRKGFVLAVRGDALTLKISKDVSKRALRAALGKTDRVPYDLNEREENVGKK